MQVGIKELEAEMSRVKATLDEQTKEVDEAKRAASKAAKALEQVQKDISSRVGCFAQRIRYVILWCLIMISKSERRNREAGT